MDIYRHREQHRGASPRQPAEGGAQKHSHRVKASLMHVPGELQPGLYTRSPRFGLALHTNA